MRDLAATLAQVRHDGRSRSVRCPAHDDDTASLSVAQGREGRVLVHCHAGCPVEAVLDAAGLTAGDLFNEPARANRHKGEIVAEYDYRDETGQRLYQVVRLTPKSFRQRRPDGASGWIWRLDAARRVLYRLNVLHSTRPKEVYVVEGEKDADALVALDLPATTNAGGAGKWTDDYAAQLVACGVQRVAILPDHDHAGQEHAEQVARSCQTAGLEVRLVRLPGLQAKGDVSDWLGAGHAADELKRILRETPVWNTEDRRRAGPATGGAPADARSSPAPVLVRLDTVQPEAVDWLWPLRLARGKLTILAGDPGLGKSFVAIDIAARVSRSRCWPDGSGPAPLGDVLMLSAEDGLADTIRPRLDRLDGDPVRVHVLAAICHGASERPFSLDRDLAGLESALDDTGAILLVIDPITAYLGTADSYKDADVRALLAPLVRLAEVRRIAVLVVMHLRKGREGNALQRLSGSIGFGAAARIVLGIGKDEHDPDRRLFAGVKSNLGKLAPTFAFRIVTDNDAAVLQWEPEEVEGIDGERLLTAGPVNHDEHDTAAEFFDAELPAGSERAQRELMKLAGDYGLSRSTLHRWKRRLGVETRKVGFRGGWTWYRAAMDRRWKVLPTEPKVLTAEDVSTFAGDSQESTETTAVVPKVLTSLRSEYLRGPVSTFDRRETAPLPLDPTVLREY